MLRRLLVCLLVGLGLQLAGVYLFACGFLPYKPVLSGLSSSSPPVPPKFDKVVFMLIDALRSDFVFSTQSSMHFVQQLIRSGEAVPFTAFSQSPTVTLPRLKALTTGSTPNFLDAILNIAESDQSSSLKYQDSWLAQIRKVDGKISIFGDDTWIKLFPGFFNQEDGTSSFFVSDFTEVDNNVTRHLSSELGAAQWDALILHYLGVDHIGHRGGPYSPYMAAKQHEMDDIVQTIYENIAKNPLLKDTLLILCGDHGMNEAGNHGGNSVGETSAVSKTPIQLS